MLKQLKQLQSQRLGAGGRSADAESRAKNTNVCQSAHGKINAARETTCGRVGITKMIFPKVPVELCHHVNPKLTLE